VRFVTSALAFAVVLAFAGVLRELFFRDNHHPGYRRRGAGRRFGMTGDWLSVETGGGAAEETGEGCCHSEIAHGARFHELFLSSVRSGDAPEVFGFDLL
jgi:hypothetical protein